MSLPNIDVTFRRAANTTIAMGSKGTVALVVKDSTAEKGGKILTREADIPADLTAENLGYVTRAFIGNDNAPNKVLLYVLAADGQLSDALDWLGRYQFDYFAGPAGITSEECTAVVKWIKELHEAGPSTAAAVLPDTAADNMHIINFAAEDIQVAGTTYTAGQYCSRIAGLLAGTSVTTSATYAVLSEVSDTKRLTRTEGDAAVDAGKLILIHDGEKVKIGRAVNSLTTLTDGKTSSADQKIRVVEIQNRIRVDLVATLEDSYVGKYPNTYDNKVLLLVAIRQYFRGLEDSGLLVPGTSSANIDTTANEEYLETQGTDTTIMTAQELKEAYTGEHVFISAAIQEADTMEDISVVIDH